MKIGNAGTVHGVSTTVVIPRILSFKVTTNTPTHTFVCRQCEQLQLLVDDVGLIADLHL